ncbi:hypothetical protein PSQ19_17620 [Devosia algicola]|uniref:ABC transporter permease n=1 Tax=Devosia algicola TaxID=3026418 RepID=A0ABY7YMH2_9HYPH|nr:hypothetical protein [Devosia algicola]WDR02407.1 hypothetical protein PSQ19_17620 [Devosia algicola]
MAHIFLIADKQWRRANYRWVMMGASAIAAAGIILAAATIMVMLG